MIDSKGKVGYPGRVPEIYTNIYHRYIPIYELYNGCIRQYGVILSRLCLSFCLACASLFVSLVPPVLVNCDMLDDHCYKAFIAKFAAKGFSLGCYFFLLVCVCVCVPDSVAL